MNLVLALLLLLASLTAAAETLVGRVVRVIDGDTVYVLDATHEQYKIRLAGIDAPERNQPFGKKSKQHLLDLVGGKYIAVLWHKRDKYGRFVSKLVLQGQDINLMMVSEGLAWWYRKYAHEQSPPDRVLYEQAEAITHHS